MKKDNATLATDLILAAINDDKESKDMTGILADLLTRTAQIKNIFDEIMNVIQAREEQDVSVLECILRNTLEETGGKLDDLADDFSGALCGVIQNGLIETVYYNVKS